MYKEEQRTNELLLGAHMSIAGGMHTAVERAQSIGCTAMQVFVKNSNQWSGKAITVQDAGSFKAALADSSVKAVLAHDSYLINLCAMNEEILKKSRTAMQDEIKRCALLGISMLNFHPGSHTGRGEEDGIKLIAESINIVHEQTRRSGVRSVLETTAGQGTALGRSFEELRAIIDLVEDRGRMAVCIDTCHIFAAGYDISNEKGYEETMRSFDAVIGLDRLVAFHINDSKKGLGSHVDRHEHIGKGAIGLEGFRLLMNDPRLRHIPKILETPKGVEMKEDVENMKALKGLVKK
jgi:deoxyribonuclease-4